jgi:hypothetical protein
MNRLTCFILVLALTSCNNGVRKEIDAKKVDIDFFVGEYKTSYDNEIEYIYLNSDKTYDYRSSDTTIKNAGTWYYTLAGKYIEYIILYLYNYPNFTRKNPFSDEDSKYTNLSMQVVEEGDSTELGDIFTTHPTLAVKYYFVKTDKSKNHLYLAK